MNITFVPLAESHFPLLLKWLESPHVKHCWDQDITYTLDLVNKKYGDYVRGYKIINTLKKPIQAFIICVESKSVGYVQIYNAHDFRRSQSLLRLPEKLGAFDIFIGEADYLRKNIASQSLLKLFDLYAKSYSHVFVNPDINNIAAIKTYEKAGFKKILQQQDTKKIWMLGENSVVFRTEKK